VLESVRQLGKACSVIVITSDKCYENPEGAGSPRVAGFYETDAMGGHDPYSASKGAAELVVASYCRSFFDPAAISRHGVKLASARAGNVIGGGDWAKDRIVTDLVRCLSEGKPVPVRNPSAVRPWQHVLEPLAGYIALAEAMLQSDDPRWCSAWNFGPGRRGEATVQELVSQFCVAWGEGRWEDVSDPSQPHEASVLRLSIDKAAAQLNWRPRWSLGQAVTCTAEWYRRYYRRPDQSMRDVCLGDLDAYVASAEASKE
jgi:CDP-glucose 4,6-dehydratase